MATETTMEGAGSTKFSDAPSQVRVQLFTRHPDISLPENPGPILVNTTLRRYGLSTLVNTLLKSQKPTPFEFLINKTFLRTSLDEYLTANGISSETTIAAEYVPAITPPLYRASFEHDDWVSSVDVLSDSSPAVKWSGSARAKAPGQERILSGSFDGLLRVWNMSSDVLATSSLPAGGRITPSIKAVKFISPSQIVSSGYEQIIRTWKYSEDQEGFTASLSPEIELYGHKTSIDSIDVHQPSARILSASKDHSVGFWSSKISDAPAVPASLIPSATSKGAKRRKLGPATSTPQRGPLSLLKSHTGPVSDTMFAPNDHTVAYSVSQDNSIKTWDLPTSTCVDTRSTSHTLFSIAALPSLNLLAAGSRHIVLIDPRASATTVSAMTLRGHKNFVVSLASDPESTYGLVSGSGDGTCRIWDVRSVRNEKEGRVGDSVHCIHRESVKGENKMRVAGQGVQVFGVCWDKDVGIVSASEDKRVQINGGKGIVGEKPL